MEASQSQKYEKDYLDDVSIQQQSEKQYFALNRQANQSKKKDEPVSRNIGQIPIKKSTKNPLDDLDLDTEDFNLPIIP